jgi:hypothetical protein
MIATIGISDARLLRQWRRQMAAHCSWQHVAARKGFAALTFLDNSNRSTRFVDINNLFVLLLFEDDYYRYDRAPLRLCGYKVRDISHGVEWGGAENCKLFKDATLTPQHGARGQRLDRRKLNLIEHALRLDRRLSRAARHPAAPWPNLQLPRLWAGFRPNHAAALRGEGPEFENECAMQCARAMEFFHVSAQCIEGLTCYQLDWISGQLDGAVAVFAEVTYQMRHQICRIGKLPDGLSGFQGSSVFDFFSNHFRGQTGNRPRRPGNRYQKHLVPQCQTVETTLV